MMMMRDADDEGWWWWGMMMMRDDDDEGWWGMTMGEGWWWGMMMMRDDEGWRWGKDDDGEREGWWWENFNNHVQCWVWIFFMSACFVEVPTVHSFFPTFTYAFSSHTSIIISHWVDLVSPGEMDALRWAQEMNLYILTDSKNLNNTHTHTTQTN